MSANGFPTRIPFTALLALVGVAFTANHMNGQDSFATETSPQAVAPGSHNQPLFSYSRNDHPTNDQADSNVSLDSPHFDDSLRVASHNEPLLDGETQNVSVEESEPAPTANEPGTNPRRLAPQGRSGGVVNLSQDGQQGADNLPFALPKVESLTTATAGLAIVVGLFLVCITLLRKAGPGPTTTLPREAVSVLGRIPLAARHFAYLIHLGNKLVLVSVSTDQVVTIAEVTDPMEVDRLLGMCLRGSKHSTTADFQRMLNQLAKEPARGFLGKEGTAARSSTS